MLVMKELIKPQQEFKCFRGNVEPVERTGHIVKKNGKMLLQAMNEHLKAQMY